MKINRYSTGLFVSYSVKNTFAQKILEKWATAQKLARPKVSLPKSQVAPSELNVLKLFTSVIYGFS
jgi:hypothetical protein